MKKSLRTLAPVLIGALFLMLGSSSLSAQIINDIKAHLDHSFVVGNTTLPPGEYTFHLMRDSDLAVMVATNESDKTSVNFLVRETLDEHTPAHSELVFRKYGNTEVLDKIFEGGSKIGSEVAENSREEARLVHQGLHPVEQREEQK